MDQAGARRLRKKPGCNDRPTDPTSYVPHGRGRRITPPPQPPQPSPARRPRPTGFFSNTRENHGGTCVCGEERSAIHRACLCLCLSPSLPACSGLPSSPRYGRDGSSTLVAYLEKSVYSAIRLMVPGWDKLKIEPISGVIISLPSHVELVLLMS